MRNLRAEQVTSDDSYSLIGMSPGGAAFVFGLISLVVVPFGFFCYVQLRNAFAPDQMKMRIVDLEEGDIDDDSNISRDSSTEYDTTLSFISKPKKKTKRKKKRVKSRKPRSRPRKESESEEPEAKGWLSTAKSKAMGMAKHLTATKPESKGTPPLLESPAAPARKVKSRSAKKKKRPVIKRESSIRLSWESKATDVPESPMIVRSKHSKKKKSPGTELLAATQRSRERNRKKGKK